MSIGKFAAGTTLAAPTIGGGGYIAYKELSKEKETAPTPEGETSTDQSTASPKSGEEGRDKQNTGKNQDTAGSTPETQTTSQGSNTNPQNLQNQGTGGGVTGTSGN